MKNNLRNITKISRVAEMYTTYRLKDSAFNNTEITALHVIRHNKGINAEGLKNKLFIDKSAVARMIEKFETSGLILRKTDENDKRNKLIFPTEKLGNYKLSMVDEEQEFYDYLIKDVPKKDFEVFSAVLEMIYIKSKAERKNKFKGIGQ